MGTHQGSITKKADAALTLRHLLVKIGSDINHIAVNGAGDMPLGVCPDSPAAAEDNAAVLLLGSASETIVMVASAAITAGVEVYTAASGKISALSASAGDYYKVGRALEAASADEDEVEVEPCYPVKVTVSA